MKHVLGVNISGENVWEVNGSSADKHTYYVHEVLVIIMSFDLNIHIQQKYMIKV